MGRRKMNTAQVTCRLDFDLLEELKSINPALVTASTKPDVDLKFRHGALGKYIGRLISADIEARKKRAEDELLAKFT